MPTIMKPCSYPGCGVRVPIGTTRCEKCEAKNKARRNREHRERLGTATQRGYNHQWRKARVVYLKANPLCVKCLSEGRTAAAVIVDHIVDHKGDKALFWNQSNWQALCKPCHDSKTWSTFGYRGGSS